MTDQPSTSKTSGHINSMNHVPNVENITGAEEYVQVNQDFTHLNLSHKATYGACAHSEPKGISLLIKSPTGCHESATQALVQKPGLRKSEEDLIHTTCAGKISKPKVKSDSLSDLIGCENLSGFCYVNSLALFGGSASAPTLVEAEALEESVSLRKSASQTRKRSTPKIVIDMPSDDEDDNFDDDSYWEEYYKRHIVLSDWEEICRDLKVTEL